MPYHHLLFAVLVALSTQTAGAQQIADAAMCQGEAVSVYLPARPTDRASNIVLAQFQYRSKGNPCAPNISHDELMRLYSASKSLTSASFSSSKKTFVLFVKYALTKDSPAKLEMKASIPTTNDEALGLYYDKAAKLTDYHSLKGIVEVFFRYEIYPSPLKSKAPSGADGG